MVNWGKILEDIFFDVMEKMFILGFEDDCKIYIFFLTIVEFY